MQSYVKEWGSWWHSESTKIQPMSLPTVQHSPLQLMLFILRTSLVCLALVGICAGAVLHPHVQSCHPEPQPRASSRVLHGM